jgi:hypothetical protein
VPDLRQARHRGLKTVLFRALPGDVDLNRWLSDSYRIPAKDDDEDAG